MAYRLAPSNTLDHDQVAVSKLAIFRNAQGIYELANPDWPKRCVVDMVDAVRAPYYVIKNDCVDVKLANARAVYKIVKTDVARGTFTGELVYEEAPE